MISEAQGAALELEAIITQLASLRMEAQSQATQHNASRVRVKERAAAAWREWFRGRKSDVERERHVSDLGALLNGSPVADVSEIDLLIDAALGRFVEWREVEYTNAQGRQTYVSLQVPITDPARVPVDLWRAMPEPAQTVLLEDVVGVDAYAFRVQLLRVWLEKRDKRYFARMYTQAIERWNTRRDFERRTTGGTFKLVEDLQRILGPIVLQDPAVAKITMDMNDGERWWQLLSYLGRSQAPPNTLAPVRLAMTRLREAQLSVFVDALAASWYYLWPRDMERNDLSLRDVHLDAPFLKLL